MAVSFNLATKHANCTINGWTVTQPATKASNLIVQLDTELTPGTYVEWVLTSMTGKAPMFGVCNAVVASYDTAGTAWYWYDGTRYPGATAYGAAWTTGDILGVGYKSNGTLVFYRNGVAQPELVLPAAGFRYPAICNPSFSASSSVSVFRVGGDITYLPAGFTPLAAVAQDVVRVLSIVSASGVPVASRGSRVTKKRL